MGYQFGGLRDARRPGNGAEVQRESLRAASRVSLKGNVLLARYLVLALLTLACLLCTTASADTTDVTVHVIQQPTTHDATRSLAFLASGYQSESAFLADVAACISTLTNSTGGVAADPWPRYIALFNIYAVYEASPEVGASRPQSHDYDCSFMSDCGERLVANNLRCAFGSPNPQLMSCDITRVRALAAFAPVQDVVVVLVNDAEPSGAGAAGVAYITNMPAYMPFMLVHYLNRAVAGLQEEYSLRIKATHGGGTFTAPNCAAPSASAYMEQWAYWQNYSNAGLATTDSSLTQLGDGCSLASYVAPTHGGCLMQSSSIPYMCPVCKEKLSVSLYDPGVRSSVLLLPSAAQLNLTAGRCPPLGYTTYVASSSAGAAQQVTPHLYLSLGPFAFQSDVSVVWTSANGTVLATNTQTLTVANASAVWELPTTVTATIVDDSPNVRPSVRAVRRANMTSTTIFTVSEWTAAEVECADSAAAPQCFSSRAVFSNTAILPSAVCALPSAKAAATTAATAAATTDTAEVLLPVLGKNPPKDKVAIIVSSAVCGGVTLLFVTVFSLLYYGCVYRRPREVLNPTPTDAVVYTAVAAMSPLGVALAGLTIAVVCCFVPAVYYAASPVILTVLVMACVVYVVAALNYCGVLLRWYYGVLVCGVLLVLLGGGFLATGLFALVFYLDRGSHAFSDRIADLWQSLLNSPQGSAYLCDKVQLSLKCSGYHAGCFMTASAECPVGCVSNVHYVNSCEVPFMYYMGGLYLPIAIVALASGFWFVLLGTLDVTYYLRFRQLPRNGRLRRTYRTSRTPPMAPVTFNEVKELRRMFALVCANVSNLTVDGETAVRFLTTVFAETLSESYQRHLRACPSLTFDALMTMHFPHAMQPAPSLAGQDGADESGISLLQLDLNRYAEVAGTLSPEVLQRLLRTHAAQTPLPTEEALLRFLQAAAAHSADAAFCHGLTTGDLAGLRGAWTALHPAVSGTLTVAELVVFYAWSHAGAVPLSAEGLAQWKTYLDVTRAGDGIGWREFCYPYAQKALNQKAETYLKEQGCAVPPGNVTRATVARAYGSEECEAVFLPREKAAPMARVVAYLLALPSSLPPPAAAAAQTSQKSVRHRMDGIVKSLKAVST